MSETTKRLLLIFGFLISVVVIALALYFAFFRAAPAPTQQPAAPVTAPNEGGLAPAQTGAPTEFGAAPTTTGVLRQADEVAKGGITQTTELTNGAIFSPTLSGNGESINFYDARDGLFYQTTKDGDIETLSDKRFPSLEKATWDRNAQKAILEFPDGSNVVYDFDSETQVTLPKHWEDFDFSPTTDELIAKSIGLDPENRWLVVANASGSNVKSIQALGENERKVQVNWSPNNQVVAFSDTAEGIGGFDRRNIIPLGKERENIKALTVEGLGFQSKWSPDGKKLLYSVSGSYSNYRPLLWVVDASVATMGENRRSLSLNTWVEKCTFRSATTVLCAVPRGLPTNAGLQPSVFADLPDALYEVDITTGAAHLIAIPEGDKVMNNLSISTDQSTLYFTNAQTGQLEFMKLK